MSKRVCRMCHDHFDVDEVRFSTDGWYGPGRYDWACKWAGCLLCENCANKILYTEPQVDENGNEYEIDPDEVIYPGLND